MTSEKVDTEVYHDSSKGADMKITEVIIPWALVMVLGFPVASLAGYDSGSSLSVTPWLGLFASMLWINYRFSGSPLTFVWGYDG